jgi:RND family efflux transporter MFP subunit
MTATPQHRNSTMRTLPALLTFSLALSASCKSEGEKARLPAAPPPAAQPAAVKPVSATPLAAPAAATAEPAGGDSLPPPPPGSAFLSGQTEAHRKSTLTPKVSSTVTRVHVRDGDIVRTGQALVTLDTRDFQLRLQQALAGLQAAKVQLDSAKLDWDRTKALLADKAVPQSQFDMVDARYKGAQAGVLQAETAVAMGRKALSDATVRAPFGGIIVKRLVNEGEYASVMPATPLVVIEEDDPLDLRVQVPSSEIGKVSAGDPVHARFPATGQTLDARLTRVVAALDPRTRNFAAVAEIPNHDHALRSGLYAEVTLTRRQAPDAAPPKGKASPKAGSKTASKPAARASKD